MDIQVNDTYFLRAESDGLYTVVNMVTGEIMFDELLHDNAVEAVYGLYEPDTDEAQEIMANFDCIREASWRAAQIDKALNEMKHQDAPKV